MDRKVVYFILVLLIIVGGTVGVYYYLNSGKQTASTDPEIKKIQDRGTLIVATDATYPPMEDMNDKGEIFGFDMDVAKEIANDLGVQPKFIKYEWTKIFDSVKSGEVDMIISSVTITPERAQIMAFSDPYFNAGQVIVVLSSNNTIKKPEDMAGKKVGVQTETTSMTETLKYVDPSLIVEYDYYTTAPDDLKNGTVDAVVIDYAAAKGLINDEPTLKIANDPFTQEFYGIAVQKSDSKKMLLTEINKSIRRIKENGRLKEIEQEWLE